MKFFTEKSETQEKPQEKVLDVKSLLQLTRKLIDENNLKQAQQCCKKVLRQKSQNYLAHVFLGKSYGKSNDALMYYEKAIELKPDQPLAWQGLAQYYEAKDEVFAKTKLLTIYDKILKLNIEEDYAKTTLIKNGNLGCLLKNTDTISNFIRYIKTQNNEKLIQTAKTQLILLLKSIITYKEDDIPEIIEILKKIDIKELSEGQSELIILGNLIIKNNDFVDAIEQILALPFFPRSFTMKTWLCERICKIFFSKNTLVGFNIREHIGALVAGIEDTKYGKILRAVAFYEENMYEHAYKKSMSVFKENLNDIEELEARFMLNCSKMTSDITRTKNLCNFFLRKESLNNPAFINTVNTILLSCYMTENDFKKVLSYLKKIPIDQIDSVVLYEIGCLFLKLIGVDRPHMWQLLDSTDYLDLFKAFDCIKERNFSSAIEILTSYDKHPLKYYYLGISYMSQKLNDNALESLQKAAELLPSHPAVLYNLGDLYYNWKSDIKESRKYFEKAYALRKTDSRVINMLTTVYKELGLNDLEFDVLLTAFNTPETCDYWVCIKLGQICMSRKSLEKALFYLQEALNKRPREIKVLEWIGDIHYDLNEYDRALMVYNRILENNTESGVHLRCLTRIGHIYTEQVKYHDALNLYKKILDVEPCNVSALKGITENRISLVLKYVADKSFIKARNQLQIGFDLISAAVSNGVNDLVHWILYGDLLFFMTKLPNEHSYVIIRRPECEDRKKKVDIYKVAIMCYSNVIKFRHSSTLFKYALTYFEYYCETMDIDLCKTAYNLAVLYIKINPNFWPIWDLLGKIAYQLNKYETAYFSFCKAKSIFEDSNFKDWSDLGVFYLQLNKKELANYRYDRFDSNTFAPTLVKEELTNTISNSNENSETIDNNVINTEEINKLEITEWIRTFQTQSGQPNVPQFDAAIDSFKNVPNTTELIKWYLYVEDESAFTLCARGNEEERKGLLISAMKYYDLAYAMADDTKKKDILSHKGRIYTKRNEYEAAVNAFSGGRVINLNDILAFANALYKTNNYEKSYAYYCQALRLCTNVDQRVCILVEMSNSAFRVKGLNEGGKLIVQALNIKGLASQEFKSSFFRSFVYQKVEIELIAHVMSFHFDNQLDKTIWWWIMALNYLRGVGKYAKLARCCIKRAIRLNTVNERNGKLYAVFGLAELYAGNRPNAMNFTRRAIEEYPNEHELWTTYIICIAAQDSYPRQAELLHAIIDRMRKLPNISPALDRWLINVEQEFPMRPEHFEAPAIDRLIAS